MRILVVSHLFMPGGGIGGLRVAKTVKYLLRFGHDVRVLTTRPGVPGTAGDDVQEDRIVRTASIDPLSFVRRLRPTPAAKAGPASGALPASGAEEATRSSFRRRTARKLRRLARNAYRAIAIPDQHVGWTPFALSAGERLGASWKPDLIFASASPYTSLVVGAALAKRLGIPWIAELRDLWSDNHYYDLPRWRHWLDRRMEQRVLGSAAGMVTVSEPLAEQLRQRFDVPIGVVLNGFEPDEAPPMQQPRARNEPLSIGYFGRFYEDHYDASTLLTALARMNERAPGSARLELRGPKVHLVAEMAADRGIANDVLAEDPVPRETSLALQGEMDVLVLFLSGHPSERGVYTGKLFEYLGARKPILVTGLKDSAAAMLVERLGVGLATTDPAAAERFLVEKLEEKRRTGSVAVPPVDLSPYTRERQTRALEDFLLGIAHA